MNGNKEKGNNVRTPSWLDCLHNDGDDHYISVPQLAKLYSLAPNEYIVGIPKMTEHLTQKNTFISSQVTKVDTDDPMNDQFTLATYRKSDNSIVYTLFEGDQQHSLEIPVLQLVSAHDLPSMVKQFV